MSTPRVLVGASGWSYADWAGRIRGYLAPGVSVSAFADNHCQGDGPATAGVLFSRLTTPVLVP